MVRVSVVVCTKNEENYIEDCLKALQNQTIKPEIIIIDSHSKDNTIKIAKKYTDRIFYEKDVGLGAARDIAAQHATGEIVAYCDADARPRPNWVENITKLMKDNAGLSGPVIAHDGPWHIKLNLGFWAKWFPRFLAFFGVHNIWGSNMAFTKEALIKHKFKYRFLEDCYMKTQLKKAKLKFKFSKELETPISSRRFQKQGFYEICSKYYIGSLIKYKLTGKRDSGYY